MKLFLSLVVYRSINGLHYNLLPVHNSDGSLISYDEMYEMLMERDHYLALTYQNKKVYFTNNELKTLAINAYDELPLALNMQLHIYFNFIEGVKKVQEVIFDE
jgi:hypothetical protein